MSAFLVALVAAFMAAGVWELRRSRRIEQAADRHVSRASIRRLEQAGIIPPER